MRTPVLVVDDHRTFADLMRLGLDAQPDLECVAVAHSVDQARRMAAAVPFSAAVIDLGLPDGDGARLVAELSCAAPHARLVVLTAHPRSDTARRALACGAQRVLPKHGRFDEVLNALRERGDRPTQRIPAAALTPRLSPREQEVIELLAEGLDVRNVANRLNLSVYTVRDHVKAILGKLGARTQLEAIVMAARAGIVLLEPR